MHVPEPSRAGATGGHEPFPSQQMGRAWGSSAIRRHHGSELAWGGVPAPLTSTPGCGSTPRGPLPLNTPRTW